MSNYGTRLAEVSMNFGRPYALLPDQAEHISKWQSMREQTGVNNKLKRLSSQRSPAGRRSCCKARFGRREGAAPCRIAGRRSLGEQEERRRAAQ